MPKRILILSATDGSGGVDFCKSLRLCGDKYHIIASDTNVYRLHNALPFADEHLLLPDIGQVGEDRYWEALLRAARGVRPDFVYAADTNRELALFSRRREEIPIRHFLPHKDAVQIYEDKWLTWQFLKQSGITVPDTILINERQDLQRAIETFGEVWLRAREGSGGRGSVPTRSLDFAIQWIQHNRGWGEFTAAQRLTSRMATWIGVWRNGNLIASQARNRLHWDYSHLSPSGVSGITGAQSTTSDPEIQRVAIGAIKAIPYEPHGIVSVDLTYDSDGRPNPTEIQACRFYSSIYFLARAGLNLPSIYIDVGLGDDGEDLRARVRPLRDGLVWLKTVGCAEQLTTLGEIELRRHQWSSYV